MKLQGRELSRRMRGRDVRLLHSELEKAGFPIPAVETILKCFGTATFRAVMAFQRQHGLPVTGVVDERTARAINAALEVERPPPFAVFGRLRHPDGRPAPDVLVRAVDRDLRAEEVLGETTTDRQGGYRIAYTAEQFQRAEKGTADVIVRAFDPQGRELAASETFFNAPSVLEVDLVVTPAEAPELSEYEHLLQTLAPVLNGVVPAEFRAEDIDFLAGEAGLERRHLKLLAEASRLARDAGLPAEAFYGWGRRDFALELASLLARDPQVLRQALELAIQERFIPARLRQSFDEIIDRLEQLRVESGVLVARQVVGRLLNEDTGAPLAGFTVRAFDLDAGPEPRDLGHDISDGNGLFVFVYFAPPDPVQEDDVAAEQDRRLRIHVLGLDGEEIHQATILAPTDQAEVVAVPVPVPKEDEPTVALEQLADSANLELPPGLLAVLADHGIETLADIRKEGGISHLADLPVAPDHPAVRALEAHASLSGLSPDVGANAAVIDAGFADVTAVAHAPRTTFVGGVHAALGDFKAARLQVEARARTAFLNNVVGALRADHANGFATSVSDDASIGDVTALFPDTCRCGDCEAALGPLAYLAELLDYTVTYVKRRDGQNETPFILKDLRDRFHQFFGDLPAACEEAQRQVPQVRICVEVLRRYLADDESPVDETEYRIAAYTALLTRIGTSFAEIRLAHTEDDETRKALAGRLGIDAVVLDRLLLDPAAQPEVLNPLTDGALDQLFGLVDTGLDRHPLSTGAKRGDDRRQITRWNLDGLLWNRHTAPDGTIYVSLTSPAANVFRVEIFRDQDRTALVASGERTTARGSVALVAEDGSDLVGRFEIDFVADTAGGIEIVALPHFLSWRLQYLRARWRERDWPRDPYTLGAETLPIIEPDVIGPDDLRTPEAGSAAFDLWRTRREWVDDRLEELAGLTKTVIDEESNASEVPDVAALLDRMYQPVAYGDTEVTVWADTTPPDAFTALHADLTQGNEVDAAVERLKEDLRLTVAEFNRLIAIRDKAARWEADPRSELVKDEEWRAFFSILVQAQKRTLYPAWIDEERDEGVKLDPKTFWISLREPEIGYWPPVLPAGQLPLIDPAKLGRNSLAEPTVGREAIDLLDARREALRTIHDALERELETSGFEALLQQALGHPTPGDPLQHDLAELRSDLNSSEPAVAAAARGKIEDDLHMTVESFTRLLDIKAKAEQDDPARKPTQEELTTVFAILTTARKVKHEYAQWRVAEQAANLVYWNTLKARLPPWRTSAEARSTWQQALLRRSQTPHLDPDLVRANDLRDSLTGETAELWQARRDFIKTHMDALRAAREAETTDLAGFDKVFETTLGVPAAELDALARRRGAGKDIAKRLDQLSLSNEAFDHLRRIRRLAKESTPILAEEWEDVISILMQVRKRRKFAEWREQERERRITLSPDDFKIPEPPPLVFPTPEPERLPAWRASAAARREWQRRLQSRIDQEQTTIDSLQAAVSATEAETLPLLRDALIRASDAEGNNVEAKAGWITAHLLIDARVDGCQVTGRASQAIETLQVLLWALRTGQLNDSHPDLVLDADDFDEAWQWLGSYPTWRAAMQVFLYPENILLPSLRKWQTPAFRELVQQTRATSRLTPKDACEAAKKYADYFHDVCTLELEASVVARTDIYVNGCREWSFEGDRHLVYLFARGGATGTVYYCRYDPRDDTPYAQSFWAVVPGLPRSSTVIGAAAYRVSDNERFIYLFAHVAEAAKERLVYTRFNLAHDRWDDEANYLDDLPENATSFSATVKQRNREDEPPHLAMRAADGTIYERYMNREGADWDQGDWRLVAGRAQGILELCGMIEPAPSEYYLIGRRRDGWLYYRLFGEWDDGRWRGWLGRLDIGFGAGAWLGGFPWPGTDYVYAFWRIGQRASVQYAVLRRSNSELAIRHFSTFEQFDNEWLRPVTGVGLSSLSVTDSTRYAGMTLLRFFALDPADYPNAPPHIKPVLAASVRRRLYEKEAQKWIDHIAGQWERGDTPAWRDWKHADDMVRQFASGVTLKQVLERLLANKETKNVAISFTLRNDPTEMIVLDRDFHGLSRIVSGVGDAPADLKGRITYRQTVRFIIEEFARVPSLLRRSTGLPHTANAAFSREPLASSREIFVRSEFSRGTDHRLSPIEQIPVAPFVTEPLEITDQLSAGDLQIRRHQIWHAFDRNKAAPSAVRIYLEEAYYFVPVHLGLQLQQHSHFGAALDWYRSVYDYSAKIIGRKIYDGLRQEEALAHGYERAGEWWLDPLNPHAIARTRANAYTRFTVLSLVRCFLAFADAEFTRDTAESVARAGRLYTTALELLGLPELKQELSGCDDVIGQLGVEVGEGVTAELAELVGIWDGIEASLWRISERGALETAIAHVRQALALDAAFRERLAAARRVVTRIRATLPGPPSLAEVIETKHTAIRQAHALLPRQADADRAVARFSVAAGVDFTGAVSRVSAVPVSTLETRPDLVLAWLRLSEAILPTEGSTGPSDAVIGRTLAPVNAATIVSPALVRRAKVAPLQAVRSARKFALSYVPTMFYSFCIPPNPTIAALRLHAEVNLYKLRTCRNIAGEERQPEPYVVPTSVESGRPPTIGMGGGLVLPGTITFRPTPYRYAVLIERAKHLVGFAQQTEAAFLSALERRDAEYYHLLRARQELRLGRAGVRLQDLRVREAEGGVRLAELQRDRAEVQLLHYERLLNDGKSFWENAARRTSAIQALVGAGALIAAAVSGGGGAALAQFGASQFFGGMTSFAQLSASFERREQEWKLQAKLARNDGRIGDQQIRLARDRFRVVGQERVIAEIQAQLAEVTANFLANKFTNVELYDWMVGVLEGVYRFFLQQATSTARLAENQLAFERQAIPPAFVRGDYWETPLGLEAGDGTDGAAPNWRGLTGSARLLQDIVRLDQYAFETDKRKLQLTRTLSLARLAPAEFQHFRETGVLRFSTPMEIFDRDFPGHYLRLIKSVRTSVVALIPPAEGIKATLSTTGLSRVVVGSNGRFQTVQVKRPPESVALSSPSNATGLFELAPQTGDMLFPFEGMGVDTAWEFQMPKAANQFAYHTIADVLLTFEYTALNSFTYREQVIQELDSTISADRPFSFRQEFADPWYDLHNPEQTDTPMTIRFKSRREDFPPNIDALQIHQVALFFARGDGASFEIPVAHLHFTEHGTAGAVGGGATSVDGIISTRSGSAASWMAMLGKSPIGEWELALPNTEEVKKWFKEEEIEDMLFVVTYSGRTPAWPT